MFNGNVLALNMAVASLTLLYCTAFPMVVTHSIMRSFCHLFNCLIALGYSSLVTFSGTARDNMIYDMCSSWHSRLLCA